MYIKNLIKELKSKKEFKDWKKSHKEDYLVHLFKMLDEANKEVWQLGYYSKGTDRITTFILENKVLSIVPEGEVFKDHTEAIIELDLKKVKIDFEEAVNKAETVQKEHYSSERPLKIIFILQNIEKKEVWNITYVTSSFKTLNIKINAESGKIESHSLASLMGME
jgi:hypothetical protein